MSVYTLPNLLTFFRILSIPLIAMFVFFDEFVYSWLAFSFYVLACITDFADGYLARTFQQISAVGRFLDPIADKLLVSTLLIMLVAVGRLTYLDIVPAVLIVNREIFVSGLREFLADYKVIVHVDTLGKWKTTVQMLSLGFLIVGSATPTTWHITMFGVALLWLASVLTLVSGFKYLVKAFPKAS